MPAALTPQTFVAKWRPHRAARARHGAGTGYRDPAPDLFSRLVTRPWQNATTFMVQVRQLFAAMATGGFFGVETIKHVDGGLFTDDSVLVLDADSLRILAEACGLNWSAIEPVILGTSFERGLDPDKRSQPRRARNDGANAPFSAAKRWRRLALNLARAGGS